MQTNRSERGFALIMALLILMVLTFLGLALATTTSTELQIGYNYKWGLQAQQNAEAGLELAKRFLRQQTWSVLVPQPRDYAQMSALPAWGSGPPSFLNTRDFENSDCDVLPGGLQGVGYGVVLQPANAQPFQNVTTFLGQSLGGAFTVWVRRSLATEPNGQSHELKDVPDQDRKLVVTVEGVAPFQAAATATAYAQRRQAVRLLEVELTREEPGDCENDFTGQAGMGALGSNYDPCSQVSAGGIPNATTEVNPNQ